MLDLLWTAGCAVVGYKLGGRYLSTGTEQPVAQSTVGAAEIVLTHQTIRTHPFYRVYVVVNGASPQVWGGYRYAEALSVIGAWQKWLLEGGTLEGWYLANQTRAQEMALLERSLG